MGTEAYVKKVHNFLRDNFYIKSLQYSYFEFLQHIIVRSILKRAQALYPLVSLLVALKDTFRFSKEKI